MEISDSPAKGRSFFKIIFSEISLHHKTIIPRKFVRKYGDHLSVRVYLKAPGHAVWDVDLERCGDKVWLQNGWSEFARFYSLCFGHFLVFQYQGNSHFYVSIFDKSCTEIDYPIVSTMTHMDEQEKFTRARKRVTIHNDELKACKKTRANSACTEACHFGECLMRKLQHQKIAQVISDKALLDDNIQSLKMLKPKKESSDNETDSSPEDMTTRFQGTSAGQSGVFKMATKGKANSKKGDSCLGASAKALALAKDFKSKNPSFILNVLPSYINGRCQVDIKRDFAQMYMRSKQTFEVCLQVEGVTWHVMCRAYWNRCRFGRGWGRFAEGNSLSVGDVCVFELVDRAKMLLNVFIYREAKC